ncbi:GNAT family N-acetyltransferase [Paenibacillus riograndensis]|uniref:GNAT family acetyltransferase n=2 Tax=Paenibacillus riograndensis TaxID=483937 RepID=A0A132TRE7_9BACL|nr:GNAT family N-acetyltransferase [Paenibacillus riograndensis]KWX73723.1 GNAT family acetyltransferase [Paenibacillus riograndensis]CQR58720.1 GCN5-related N-acetyltransferase [Paenibacillus riograndensis SBR5]
MPQLNWDALTIRPSEIRDVRELIVLDNMIWTEDTSPGPLMWRSREDYLMHAPPGSQLVALKDGELCGYVGFGCPSGMESNRHVCEVNIAVHPKFQRMGIGGQLIEAIKSHAAENRIRKLRLRVLSCNEPALAFYRKCGFVEEGRLREEFFLGGRYVDEVFMSCMLTGGKEDGSHLA